MLSAPDVLLERCGYRLLLRAMVASFDGQLNQVVVDREIRRYHGTSFRRLQVHTRLCVNQGMAPRTASMQKGGPSLGKPPLKNLVETGGN
ncbi:MAG: hypothetical protein ACR2PL_19470 [Dehalococcoidia bacterium]